MPDLPVTPRIVLVATGLVLGAGVGWLGARALGGGDGEGGGGEPVEAAWMAMRGGVGSVDRTCDDGAARVAALTAEIEALETQRTLQRGQLALIGGVPEVWPEGVEPEARAAALRTDWEAAAEAYGPASVRAVDCAEPPCLALLEVWGDEAIDEGSLSGRYAHEVAASTGMGRPARVHATNIETGRGRISLIVAVLGANPEEGAPGDRRVDVRVDRLIGGAREALTAEEGTP